ncbi:hypothetical protein SOVF_006470 [Spinacia oleracea]|nr:hypothetical protein SOVF_006470 [Spinacia oleracea]
MGRLQRCSVVELPVLPFLSKFPVPINANASTTSISNKRRLQDRHSIWLHISKNNLIPMLPYAPDS